ncbi:MAG: GntR family transcriptional regulator [Lachnospiraceae bacterium]
MAQALHTKVSEYIRARIESGEYPVGSQIPTEYELSQLLEVSRPTVRQALDNLAHSGYLTRVKGKGTFVTQPKMIHESTSFLIGYQEESKKNHRTLRTKVLALQTEHAQEHVAEALHIPVGSKVTRLTRLRYLEHYNNDAPVMYTTLYVPYKLFPTMCEFDFTDASFYEILESQNLSVRHAFRTLEVISAPAEVTAGLKISPFEPVIFITSKGHTESMIPIEYAESYYPAGSSRFLIEVHR